MQKSTCKCCICGQEVQSTIAMLAYEIMRSPKWWKENNKWLVDRLSLQIKATT